MKIQAKDWDKIFAKHTSNKGFVPRIYKVAKLNSKKTNNPIKQGQRF